MKQTLPCFKLTTNKLKKKKKNDNSYTTSLFCLGKCQHLISVGLKVLVLKGWPLEKPDSFEGVPWIQIIYNNMNVPTKIYFSTCLNMDFHGIFFNLKLNLSNQINPIINKLSSGISATG